MASFQIKNFLSLTASLVNRMRGTTAKINDYNVGGVARTMVEATAQEIEELYLQMVAGLVQAIPVSVYESFSFPALPATAASGLVRVTITSQPAPFRIAASTILTPIGGPLGYAAQLDTTIPAGNTFADVPVAAVTPGIAGNLPANSLFAIGNPPPGFLSASNLVAFQNGADAETPDQQKLRFNSYVSTLARGTLNALDYGLRLATVLDSQGNVVERVRYTSLVEPYLTDPTQPVALVQAYVHNGTGSTSPQLVSNALMSIDGSYDALGKPIPGWKAAGVKVTVAAATEQQVSVTGTIHLAPNQVAATVQAAVQAAISAYIAGLTIGAPYYLAEATALAMAMSGVANWTAALPAADVIPTASVKLMPGAFTLTTA